MPFRRKHIAALRRDRRGVAYVEFALSLPILIALSMVGVETVNITLAKLRLNQIAATTADNAGRVRETISEDDVNEVMLGAKIMGERMDFGDQGRIVLSSVEPNGFTDARKGQYIRWQRCYGKLNTTASAPQYGTENKGKADGSLPQMGPTTNPLVAGPGSVMMFVEATYAYTPMVPTRIFPARVLRSEAAFMVRERAGPELAAGTSSTTSACTSYTS
jgi:Flp pilus assembly pilin Flp